MSIVHVVPQHDRRLHRVRKGADCWCEPDVLNEGTDDAGEPARVIVHSDATQRREAREVDRCRVEYRRTGGVPADGFLRKFRANEETRGQG